MKPRTNTRLDTNLIPRNKAPARSGSTLSRPSTPLKRVGFPGISQDGHTAADGLWQCIGVPQADNS